MIITIEGTRGSGKTTICNKIWKHKKAFFINEQDVKKTFAFERINKETDFIVIDEVLDYDFVYKYFKEDYLYVNKRFGMPFIIKMPDVILVKQSN